MTASTCELCHDEPSAEDVPSAVQVLADGGQRTMRFCAPCAAAWRRQHARLIAEGWVHRRPPPRARPDVGAEDDVVLALVTAPPVLGATSSR